MMIFNHFSFLHQFNTCNFGKERKWKEEPKDKKGKTTKQALVVLKLNFYYRIPLVR